MDKNSVRILLVDDQPEHRQLMKELIEDIELPYVNLQIIQASKPGEALSAISTKAPDLIVTDLHLSDEQGDPLQFIWTLRRSVMTFHVKIIVVSGYPLTAMMRHELDDVLRISDRIAKPFDMDEFQDSVRRRMREVLELRNSSTGIPGRTEGERVLSFALRDRHEHPEIEAVYLNPDLRKIGLSANDRYGQQFGNAIIDLFSKDLQIEMENLYPYPKLERTAFQIGGDEFGLLIRGDRNTSLKEVVRSAEWLARRLGARFDQNVRAMYPEPIRTWGYLHGPEVKDKRGKVIVLPLPATRIAIIPLYGDLYQSQGEVTVVCNRLHALIKERHNKLEASANSVLMLPAEEYPRYDPGNLKKLRRVVAEILDQADSTFETASFADTARWLDIHREEVGD